MNVFAESYTRLVPSLEVLQPGYEIPVYDFEAFYDLAEHVGRLLAAHCFAGETVPIRTRLRPGSVHDVPLDEAVGRELNPTPSLTYKSDCALSAIITPPRIPMSPGIQHIVSIAEVARRPEYSVSRIRTIYANERLHHGVPAPAVSVELNDLFLHADEIRLLRRLHRQRRTGRSHEVQEQLRLSTPV